MATLESIVVIPELRGKPFPDALAAVIGHEVHVVAHPGYRTRQSSSRGFDPVGFVIHWTAVSDTENRTLGYCVEQELCQLYLGNDDQWRKDGRPVVRVLSIGRTGHIGQGNSDVIDRARRGLPPRYARHPKPGDTYPYGSWVGMEVEASGSRPYTAVKNRAQFIIAAGLCHLFGWPPEAVITHAMSTSRKVDDPEHMADDAQAKPWDQAGASSTGRWTRRVADELELIRARWDGRTTDPTPIDDVPLTLPVVRVENPPVTGWHVDAVRRHVGEALGGAGYGTGPYSAWFAGQVKKWQVLEGLDPTGVMGADDWARVLER